MIAKIETDGEGLYLRPYKGKGLGSRGNGLYLKQGKRITDGSGILRASQLLEIAVYLEHPNYWRYFKNNLLNKKRG